MAEEVLIRVEGVSKKFCRDLHTSLRYGLVDLTREMVGKPRTQELRPKEFWAVKDVSFELKRGQSLGLIGRNGAGKTTLLRMLNGLIKPDTGRIEMRGRIGALIALGAGFNPILTGRENIYVNGSILGLTRAEIDARMDDIVEFAEVQEFIDSPVSSYSSGMNVRLGFAVATAMDPDVIILDEVLAVGDAAFRSKCYQRIASMRKQAAVIFVSHIMEQVTRICDRALVVSKGQVVYLGDTMTAVDHYDRLNAGGSGTSGFVSLHPDVISFHLQDMPAEVTSQAPLAVTLSIDSKVAWSNYRIRCGVYQQGGALVAGFDLLPHEHGTVLQVGLNRLRVDLPNIPLKRGRYFMNFNFVDEVGDMFIWSYMNTPLIVVGGSSSTEATCVLAASARSLTA